MGLVGAGENDLVQRAQGETERTSLPCKMQRRTSGHNQPIPGTRSCFLIGHPVHHSLSPIIHQAAYRALGMDWFYGLMDVLEPDLPAVLEGIDGDRVVGANVTIPYKQRVFDLLDECTETARAVGAVNTVFVRDGKRMGDNTDVDGFLQPLRSIWPEGHPTSERHALILGSGGAARAVAHALTRVMPFGSVTVASRNVATARAIPGVAAASWEERDTLAANTDLIVNTTPLGMHPTPGASPLSDVSGLHEGQVVYDLIYAPRRTLLMDAAHRQGASIIGGLPMLVGQAALAFKRWSGRDMPLEPVMSALDALGQPDRES